MERVNEGCTVQYELVTEILDEIQRQSEKRGKNNLKSLSTVIKLGDI